MHFFWTAEISMKGVPVNNLIWTGPQSCPKISLNPDYNMYVKKQKSFTRLKLRSKRNVSRVPSFYGSITMETAFVLPLFLFFCIQMISFISLIQVHSVLEAALHQETAQAALYAYAYDKFGIDMQSGAGDLLGDIYIKNRVIQRAGEEYLDRSMIVGGSRGIHIMYTEDEDVQETVDIILFYQVKPAVDLLGFSQFTMANRCRMKAWTGYQTENETLSEKDAEEMVYVTETGTVYHKRRNCSHLALSVREVKTNNVGILRNENGAKYYPCEGCGKSAGNTVYLTDQGNRYHTSLSCSGLKRTISIIPISEAGGRGLCSRCSAAG